MVTEPSFLTLQGIEELLETRDLVRAHYNPDLALAGVVVTRVVRTVEHGAGLAEIAAFFGSDWRWRVSAAATLNPYASERRCNRVGRSSGILIGGA